MRKLTKNKKIIPWLGSLLAGILYSAKAVWAQYDWGLNYAQNVSLYGSPSTVRVNVWWPLFVSLSLLLILIAIVIGVIRLIRKVIKKIKLARNKKKGKGQYWQSKEKGAPKKM